MMKDLEMGIVLPIVFLLTVTIGLIVVVSWPKVTQPIDAQQFLWTTVKSPITGRCYETMARYDGSNQGTAFGMGSEVPCP